MSRKFLYVALTLVVFCILLSISDFCLSRNIFSWWNIILDRNIASTGGLVLAAVGLFLSIRQIEDQIRSSNEIMGGQIESSNKIIEESKSLMNELRQVEVLEGMPEIMIELNKRMGVAEKEILFLASTPAIGASGAHDEALEFEKVLINFCEERTPKPEKVLFICYNIKDVEKFYKAQEVEYDMTVKNITEQVFKKIALLKENIKGADFLEVEFCKIPILHFVLIDTNSKDKKKRCAVIWHLGGVSETKTIKGTGFSTNNEAVIETLKKVFEKQEELARKKIDNCQYPPKNTEGGA